MPSRLHLSQDSEPPRTHQMEGGTCRIEIYRDPHLGLRARKSLHPKYQGLEAYERILKHEYEILKSVESDFVVKAHALRTKALASGDETFVLELEYLEGRDLAEISESIAGHSSQAGLEILRAFADGGLSLLRELRSLGVIHGDISPDNLFLTRSGNLKILDFSFATRAGMRPPWELVATGKSAFRSPRVRRGERARFEDDAFSLARVLEYLAGRFLLSSPELVGLIRELESGMVPDLKAADSQTEALRSFAAQLEPRNFKTPSQRTPVLAPHRLWEARLRSRLSQASLRRRLASRGFGLSVLFLLMAPLVSWAPRSTLRLNSLPPAAVTIETSRGVWKAELPLWHLVVEPGPVLIRYESPSLQSPRYLHLKPGRSQIYFEDLRNIDTLEK